MKLGMKSRAAVLVGLAVVTVLLSHIFPNAATNPETGMVMWLPDNIPGSIGKEIPIGQLEKDTLPEDTTMLRRIYREIGYEPGLAEWRQLSATLVLMGSDRRSLHEPEFCLRSLGWRFKRGAVVTIDTAAGPLEVKELQISRVLRREDGSFILDPEGRKIHMRGHYFYWWVARDSSTPHSKERIARTALNNMFRNVNDRWGYPSVQVLADPNLPPDEGRKEARRRAIEFIRDNAPGFQKSLGAAEPAAGGDPES